MDYNKIYRTRKDGHRLQPPQYKFLTDEQLKQATEDAKHRAKKYLQMPPVVKQRSDSSELLDEDPGLRNHDTIRYVFTDISYGLKDRERFIVIREPDGTLRHATWKERDRMIQTFFPKPGRQMQKPKMFEGEYLAVRTSLLLCPVRWIHMFKNQEGDKERKVECPLLILSLSSQDLLNRNEYEFILNRACVQFEPDDPDYLAVTREVYEHINAERRFDILRSTRHFGPMVFHLVWTSNIDSLLYEMVETSRIKDAALLIRLYHIIHPTAKSAVEPCEHADDAEFVMHYVRLESKKDKIQKLLQSYKELERQRQIVAEGIKQAHGISPETDKV